MHCDQPPACNLATAIAHLREGDDCVTGVELEPIEGDSERVAVHDDDDGMVAEEPVPERADLTNRGRIQGVSFDFWTFDAHLGLASTPADVAILPPCMRFFRMISLNQTEQQFIAYLDTFSRSLTPPVECRIAGGWVRDKVCCTDCSLGPRTPA